MGVPAKLRDHQSERVNECECECAPVKARVRYSVDGSTRTEVFKGRDVSVQLRWDARPDRRGGRPGQIVIRDKTGEVVEAWHLSSVYEVQWLPGKGS